jgi:hypothetical protein
MSIYELAKDAWKLAQSSDNVELVQKILDVQQQALEQQAEVMRLRAENATLRHQLEEVGLVEVAHGLYWKRLADGLMDGPFSQGRWDLERKLVRLTYTGTGTYDDVRGHRFFCDFNRRAYTVPLAFYERERIRNAGELPKEVPPPRASRGGRHLGWVGDI